MSSNRSYSSLMSYLSDAKDTAVNSIYSLNGVFSRGVKSVPTLGQKAASKIRLMPFVFLALMDQVSALQTTLFAKDPATNTEYKLEYDTADFPNLRSDLVTNLNAIISTYSYKYFNHVATPTCTLASGSYGPAIDLDVEYGRTLSLHFERGLNQILDVLCKEYDATRAEFHLTPATLALLIAVGGIACMALCISASCDNRRINERTLAEPLNPRTVEFSSIRIDAHQEHYHIPAHHYSHHQATEQKEGTASVVWRP